MSFLLSVLLFLCCSSPKQEKSTTEIKSVAVRQKSTAVDSIPKNVLKLMKWYPDVIGYKDNHVLFSDNTKMVYDDGKEKGPQELLDNPDIEDMFKWTYSTNREIPKEFVDPGRIRHEAFFKKIYGQSKEAVASQLATVKWCPTLVNQSIRITRKNNIHLKVDSLSKELDKHPEFKQYLQNIGGIFNWRLISGTNRLSMHSFGMTIDINTSFSHYWQWDCGCKNENVILKYKNKIPHELVAIFEKYGFIWGGNWYHYDTMHFEYRPELLNSI